VGELEGIPGREGLEKPHNCVGLLRLSASSWDRGLALDHVFWGKGMMMAIYPGPHKCTSPAAQSVSNIPASPFAPPFLPMVAVVEKRIFPPHRRYCVALNQALLDYQAIKETQLQARWTVHGKEDDQ